MLSDDEIMRREHTIFKRALEEIAAGGWCHSDTPTMAETHAMAIAGLALHADKEAVVSLGYRLQPVE